METNLGKCICIKNGINMTWINLNKLQFDELLRQDRWKIDRCNNLIIYAEYGKIKSIGSSTTSTADYFEHSFSFRRTQCQIQRKTR